MEQITKRDEDENNDQNMTMNMQGEGSDDDYHTHRLTKNIKFSQLKYWPGP